MATKCLVPGHICGRRGSYVVGHRCGRWGAQLQTNLQIATLGKTVCFMSTCAKACGKFIAAPAVPRKHAEQEPAAPGRAVVSAVSAMSDSAFRKAHVSCVRLLGRPARRPSVDEMQLRGGQAESSQEPLPRQSSGAGAKFSSRPRTSVAAAAAAANKDRLAEGDKDGKFDNVASCRRLVHPFVFSVPLACDRCLASVQSTSSSSWQRGSGASRACARCLSNRPIGRRSR